VPYKNDFNEPELDGDNYFMFYEPELDRNNNKGEKDTYLSAD
jgi:hypothetical protein